MSSDDPSAQIRQLQLRIEQLEAERDRSLTENASLKDFGEEQARRLETHFKEIAILRSERSKLQTDLDKSEEQVMATVRTLAERRLESILDSQILKSSKQAESLSDMLEELRTTIAENIGLER